MDRSEYEDRLDPRAKACRKIVTDAMDAAQPAKNFYVTKWDEAYNLYRNHKALRGYVYSANPADRDDAYREALREWGGADLAIPMIFSTIETIVPRLLSSNPTMTVKPRNAEAVAATRPLKELLEQQQLDIDYDLKLEPTIRRALKYGLGVQKTFWETKRRKVVSTSPRRIRRGMKVDERLVTTFDGPQVESVDIWDFFWDPPATSVETARWLIHRTWRDLAYIEDRIRAGDWFSEDGEPLDDAARASIIEAIKGSTAPEDQSTTRRRDINFGDPDKRAGRNYEILEYHDRSKVYTIINRVYVAQHDINPFFHRDLPFQICRPTVDEDEFVGISEIEPVKHLQLELNTLRSQRRDNAAYVLDRIMFYADGMVDIDAAKQRGPGAWIPTVSDPRESLFPLPVEDLPSSSYREGDEIRGDFDRTTGIDDSVAGGGAAGDTATGTELIQQAANVRIVGKGRKVAAETVRPAARQFHELNQQFFFKDQEREKTVRVDDPQTEDGFRFETLTRAILDADVDVIPDAGSMEPENKVQKRNDALTLYNQLNQNPAVDPRQVVRHLLTEHDIADVDGWLAPEQNDMANVLMVVAEDLRELLVDSLGEDGANERVTAFMEQVMEQVAPPDEQTAQQNGAGEVATPA